MNTSYEIAMTMRKLHGTLKTIRLLGNMMSCIPKNRKLPPQKTQSATFNLILLLKTAIFFIFNLDLSATRGYNLSNLIYGIYFFIFTDTIIVL